jgi:hypothetical protein
MSTAQQHGTTADGSASVDYCCYCFQKGAFTVNLEFDAFVEMQVKIAVEKIGLEETAARAMAKSVLPKLKRWRQ